MRVNGGSDVFMSDAQSSRNVHKINKNKHETGRRLRYGREGETE
jgi:hypothetical protein